MIYFKHTHSYVPFIPLEKIRRSWSFLAPIFEKTIIKEKYWNHLFIIKTTQRFACSTSMYSNVVIRVNKDCILN